jgi:hypothetical protein
MFEREVMISTLRKNSQDLARLVEELEEKPRFSGIDLRYCQEVLKKIEGGLRRVRKMDEAVAIQDPYAAGLDRPW